MHDATASQTAGDTVFIRMLAEPESISSGFKNIRIRSEENELGFRRIASIVDEHVCMKGTPENAQCGFSNKDSSRRHLADPLLRLMYSPTQKPFIPFVLGLIPMPQVFVHGN